MKKLFILLIICSSCTNYKLSDAQKKEKRKMAKEKCFVLSSMAAYGIATKILADKQTVIK